MGGGGGPVADPEADPAEWGGGDRFCGLGILGRVVGAGLMDGERVELRRIDGDGDVNLLATVGAGTGRVLGGPVDGGGRSPSGAAERLEQTETARTE